MHTLDAGDHTPKPFTRNFGRHLSCNVSFLIEIGAFVVRKTDINGRLVRFAWWALAIIAFALVIAIRIGPLGIPLERDEGEYAYAGQLILQGIPPYKLAYNVKFPGNYAAYGAIMSILGQTIGCNSHWIARDQPCHNRHDLFPWPATIRLAGRRRRFENVRGSCGCACRYWVWQLTLRNLRCCRFSVEPCSLNGTGRSAGASGDTLPAVRCLASAF